MEEIQNGISNRQTEAEDYLKKHKINELFVNITASLVFKKPGWSIIFKFQWSLPFCFNKKFCFKTKDNPKEAIIEYLERLKKSKVASVHPPSLYEDQNLHSIFGMLDPSGQGHITFRQYVEGSHNFSTILISRHFLSLFLISDCNLYLFCLALDTLGIEDYEMNPEGKSDDRIRLDVFVRESKKGLIKINSTFKK